MFTIVTFPWPVASAHVQLDGLGLSPAGQDELASEPEELRGILTARKP